MILISFFFKKTDLFFFFFQRIGEVEEEGKGGQIRATLLSNRATTLLKVSSRYYVMRALILSRKKKFSVRST